MPVLGTIRQAGEVLELFNRSHPEWGVRQVARALEIPKSNAHQLLSSLEAIGLLHRMVTGRYKLGFKILTLGQHLLTNTPWRDVAHRAMHNLEAACSETVYLGVLDGGQLIFIDQIPGSSSSAIEPSENIGHATTPHTNALGRVLLASKPWRIVQNTLEQHKAQLLDFKTELEQISEQGFAFELEETNTLECSVAAPIRNHNGDVIAAIGVSIYASKTRGITDDLQEAVVQTAALISRGIAYNPEFVAENRTQARLVGRKAK